MRIKYGLMCLSLLSCVGINAGQTEQEKEKLEKTRKQMAALKLSERASQPNSSRPNSNKVYYDSPCGGGSRRESWRDENVPTTVNLRTLNSSIWPHFQ